MQTEIFNHEFNRMFKWFTNESTPRSLKLELDFYKKLWNFFLIGDSFYFILNHHGLSIDFVSKEVAGILGYQPEEYNTQVMQESLHPDDRSAFIYIGGLVVDFFSRLPIDKLMKYKVRYDMRFRKKNGEYVRLLYQGIMLEHDEKGGILRTLGVQTDITYLKQDGRTLLTFIGMDDEPSYTYEGPQNNLVECNERLTLRERQILKLLMEGKLSKEISSILNISKQTVDTHRKNMIHKNNLNNTGELIGKAIKQGWI